MYDLTCDFDIQKHKETYINYFETIIYPDGRVEYCVPSHQEKLISVMQSMYGITRKEVGDRCPEDYYFDFMTWLLMETKCVAAWTDFILFSEVTGHQLSTLRQLKSEGIYKGEIPAAPTVE